MPTARPRRLLAAVACLAGAAAVASPAPVQPHFRDLVYRVGNMTENTAAQRRARAHGLHILNVLWEDTGRYQGSSVGPNISDVTIEVRARGVRPKLMPVIRFPNFSDKTGDVSLDRIFLPVGNQRTGGQPDVVSLREFLAAPERYMSQPEKGRVRGGSLLAARDSHALVSAQAVFLPVPQGGEATFYPVIFNYQSTHRNPAVLTLLVTRQGTSMTIVDNGRDLAGADGSYGQRLYFNAGGQRAPLTAERRSDVEANGVTANGESAESLGEDANLLMLIQVPLRYRPPASRKSMSVPMEPMASGAPAKELAGGGRERRDDTEQAVLGHGALQGPFTELAGLTVERDPRFPVRVTVQFYQATSTSRIEAATMERLAAQISRVYADADHVGSLVVPAPEDRLRPTNWEGVREAPANLSWMDFPGLLERHQRQGHGRQALDHAP